MEDKQEHSRLIDCFFDGAPHIEPCLIRQLTIGAHNNYTDDGKDHDDDCDAEYATQSKFLSNT